MSVTTGKPRSPRRRYTRALILLLVLSALLVGGYAGEWRVRAIAHKLCGGMPLVGWKQLLSTFGPYEEGDYHLTWGLVTLKEKSTHEACPYLWSTPVGDIWGNYEDEYGLEIVFQEQLIDRIYDHPEVRVRPGDVVLDIGGHLGTYARWSLLHGAEQVIMLEPEPNNIQCLERTLADELADGRVVLVKAAAWHQEGVLRFSGGNLTGKVSENGEVEVRAVTIDSVVQELQLPRVDVIKMDIEGGEPDALRGAGETMSRFGPRMALSIYHEEDHRRQIPELVRAARPEYHIELSDLLAYCY